MDRQIQLTTMTKRFLKALIQMLFNKLPCKYKNLSNKYQVISEDISDEVLSIETTNNIFALAFNNGVVDTVNVDQDEDLLTPPIKALQYTNEDGSNLAVNNNNQLIVATKSNELYSNNTNMYTIIDNNDNENIVIFDNLTGYVNIETFVIDDSQIQAELKEELTKEIEALNGISQTLLINSTKQNIELYKKLVNYIAKTLESIYDDPFDSHIALTNIYTFFDLIRGLYFVKQAKFLIKQDFQLSWDILQKWNRVSHEEIYPCAFQQFIILINIAIPDSIHTIGAGAFEGAKYLQNITFPYSLTTIGSRAFAGTAITRAMLEDWCEKQGKNIDNITIADDAFDS